MPPWKCFLIRRTDAGLFTLRRYNRGDPAHTGCVRYKEYGYHNADRFVDERPFAGRPDLEGDCVDLAKDDPRWPAKCDYCEYLFNEADDAQEADGGQQASVQRIWAGVRQNVQVRGILGIGPNQLPPGAMWLASPDDLTFFDHIANPEHGGRPGPDGKFMFIVLPGSARIFCPDGPAWDDKGPRPCPWTRNNGDPDTIVISPSIRIGGIYHGHVGANGVPPGWVTEDGDGNRHDEIGRRVN